MSACAITRLCLAAALVAGPLICAKPKPPKPVDVKIVFEWLKQGEGLSASDAADLEGNLSNLGTKEAGTRLQLLSYYAGQSKAANLDAVRAARIKHIIWLIEHDPRNGFGLFQTNSRIHQVHCLGDPLADPQGFERVAQAWLDQLAKTPIDADIVRQTVEAIQYCKPEVAEKLLTERHDQAGLGRLYGVAALGLTGTEYRNSDAAGSSAELRKGAFAKRAVSLLESASDPDMLTSGAIEVLKDGAQLWADNKLDWDYTPLGNSLLAKARAVGADSMRMYTVPTQLPARGERPPQTLRIGGNVQAANLVRKATPRYPDIAKQRGITGTVRMTALLGLDGSVLHLDLVSGPPELVEASLGAVRHWAYKPTLLNGKPCYVITVIDVNYQISR